MADAETQWSLGTFGAIAEFARDADEPVTLSRGTASLAAVTARGGIRIDLRPDMRPFAFETTTKDSWNHRIALCLPEQQCAMHERTVLTELGSDGDALHERDRDAVLFDLGLGARQVDCCVRVGDPEVAALLRAHCGQPVFGSPAMGIILAANPHRVFLSRLGRVEVFQPIPPPDGKSPDGPHTHVLPGLLRHRRTHAATEPIPDGLIPCAHVYPPHPAKDAHGASAAVRPRAPRRVPGDPAQLWRSDIPGAEAAGDERRRRRRRSVCDRRPEQRFARTNIRVALRQLKAQRDVTPSLEAWLAAHERHGESIDDPHHHEAAAQ